MARIRNIVVDDKSASIARDRRAASSRPAERSDQVKSLVRALTVLNRLALTDDGASLSELAQQVGLAPSTAHRLLTTLEQERYVHFDPERRLWTVGMQAFMTGNAFLRTRSLTGAARPHMRALLEETAETVNLAVEDQHEAVYLAQVESRQMMRAFARPGGRAPLHCSGVGKAMLAAMPEAAVTKILQHKGLPRITAKTISNTVALRDDLLRVRERGYALDDEEHAVGLRCIASAIFDERSDPVAAISVSGPMVRISDERVPVLGEAVRKKALAITAQLGGVVPTSREASE